MKLAYCVLGLLLSVAIVACGGGSDSSASKASGTATPAPVDLGKDDLGRSVTPPTAPQRVVALSPSIVELMYAVNAVPVGKPSSADYPAATKLVPDFGPSYQPSYEQIAAMKPDLIIADAIIDAGLMNDLTKLGAPVYALKVASFDDVEHGLRVVGALTGHQSDAEAQVKALDTKLTAVTAKLPATGPSVLIVAAAGPGQFIAAKDSSYLGSLVKQLGGKNIVTTEPENFRFPGFSDFSLERIVQSDPDVIVAISIGGPPGTPTTSQLLAQTPGWNTLKAVKGNHVYEVDPVVYLQSAGPRVSQILDELPRILYPSVYAAN